MQREALDLSCVLVAIDELLHAIPSVGRAPHVSLAPDITVNSKCIKVFTSLR